jgi:flagellar motor switch/type III secretory pathway protein FliN
MTLSADLAGPILAACRQFEASLAGAWSKAFGTPTEMPAARMEELAYAGPDPQWQAAGLVLLFHIGDSAAVAVLAEQSGLIPDWAKSREVAAQQRLAQLANELGAAIFPEGLHPERCRGGYVDNLAEAIARGSIDSNATSLQCELTSGEKGGLVRLIWPATTADAILAQSPDREGAGRETVSQSAGREPTDGGDFEQNLSQLPAYIRSLLRISVPVSVHLATTRQPVSRVLNIGPGSIIQFSKNCEHPLTLCVGNQPIAAGQAVKVGEKFGLKLSSMALPGERFLALRRKSGS